jgi:formate dehydrogenase subunit delta
MNSAHSKSVDNLIRMANDIATNLSHGAVDDEDAAGKVASHIRKFWSRAMKIEIQNYAKDEKNSLTNVAFMATKLI